MNPMTISKLAATRQQVLMTEAAEARLAKAARSDDGGTWRFAPRALAANVAARLTIGARTLQPASAH
jgi:hypothetical protein